ncbi:MAG: arginine decarboxylase, pyruvoyl-dependent [Planctomycetota bacterium]
MAVAKAIFLTKGVGRHKEMLPSFEEALRDAGVASFNLVHVSSIFPPYCKLVPRSQGLTRLEDGQIVYVVLARNQTNEYRRLVAASVGLAIPKDRRSYGYLSEHHSYGENEDQAGDYAEDLAASMLATIQGVDFDPDLSWDQKKEVWKISGKIYRTCNITQSAIGSPNGIWTTVIAAAVMIM